MRTVLIIAACLSLTACGGYHSSDPAQSKGAEPTILSETPHNDVRKFCDEGRAVYTVQDDNATAIAVVENARECQQPQAQAQPR